MCAIFGLWDPTIAVVERRRLARHALARLAHRGPDGEGTFEADVRPLVLGHRRLAIQGLGPQGAQPMADHRGAGCVVFNGEIFNVVELRDALAAEGVRCAGRSDTEGLVEALALWGVARPIERARGQLAFAWYEHATRTLHLVRDRLGVRPLYVARTTHRLAIASEVKGLLGLSWVDRRMRPEPCLRYLLTGRTDDVPGETTFAGIDLLEPATHATWDGSTFASRRYWRVPVDPPPVVAADVRAALDRAVSRQMIADVPIGAMVSGGIDSSAVMLLADRLRKESAETAALHLFAYHDVAALADERPYQRAVLAAVQSPHVTHWVSSSPADLSRDLGSYVDHQEEPYGDVSSYAEFCIARLARERGVRVLLSGLGGDEVFTGYPAYIGPLVRDLLREGSVGAARDLLVSLPAVMGTGGLVDNGLRAVAAAAYYSLPAPVRHAATALRSASARRVPRTLWLAGARDAWRTGHPGDGRRRLNASLRASIESWAIPRYLLHSDRMGLAHGVENRVPLLDEDLIEVALGVPTALRCDRVGLKASLRAAAGRVLPREIAERGWKLGFHAPLGTYVRGLDESLRAGCGEAASFLGRGPRYDDLAPADRWLWGNLGFFIRWARDQAVW
jgi:asparagine synthase (glutamine-hydrolysing)